MSSEGAISKATLDKRQGEPSPITHKTSHQPVNMASWWLDFFTMAGRKSENQDSLLITTCLTGFNDSLPDNEDTSHENTSGTTTASTTKKFKKNKIAPHQLPVLAILSDGVSACQFPKQASRLAVEITADNIIEGLSQLHLETDIETSQIDIQDYKGIFDDENIAGIIKQALTKANDSMYFSQAYQRVPPLLATLSGVLCIGDRIHVLHTGDSRIYRVGADSLTVLTEDHRITHGQDKGALSAALGADTRIDLQQMAFTLHQNEYLALMTDGVYEFIDPIEMQFEFSAAVTHLENTPDWNQLNQWQLSRQLCQLAFNEGSNDNLSIIMLGMGAMPIKPKHSSSKNAKKSKKTKAVLDKSDQVINQKKISDNKNQNQNKTKTENIKVNKVESSQVTELEHTHNTLVTDSTEFEEVEHPSISPNRFQLPTGLEPGDSVDGFKVDSVIARTARSDVYLVHDDAGNEYVLKSPSLMTVDDGHYLRDFLKERKIGLSLSKHRRAGEVAYNQTNPNHNHKLEDTNTVALLGSGLSESGLLRYYPVPASSTYLYHLTEYIEGESLRAFIERNGPCDIWQTHDLLTKIGMAVRVMHRNFLLHQDIKPENILLTKSGAVKLIDFGSVASTILKDNTRPPVGDLHYAAPEYYTDAPKGVHSDLFSIAVIGFELLTGKLPFTSQMLMSPNDSLVLSTQLLNLKQVPATSQQALLRALHRNTNARHQAIGEFLQDFNPDSSASLADPEPLIKRNPLLVWHGICLIQFVFIIFLLIKYLPNS